ncbi:MAG: DUF4301 family protein [Oligoflexales bacterium]|nr:DUF4301 family protein [Oligoflexales bacterium]
MNARDPKFSNLPIDFDFAEIERTQLQIKAFLNRKIGLSLPIIETCRTNNGGILRLEELKIQLSKMTEFGDYGLFIPAAGAASRYFSGFSDLLLALSNFILEYNSKTIPVAISTQQTEKFKKTILSIMNSWDIDKLLQLALPELLRDLIKQKHFSKWTFENFESLFKQLNLAKALQPALISGENYLQIKITEASILNGLKAIFFVAPFDQSEAFKDFLQKNPQSLDCQIYFPEQGSQLSTLRFKDDGEFYLDQNGHCTLVPAGHGALTKLFTSIKRAHPHLKSLFIINIDNIIGTSSSVIKQRENLIKLHQVILAEFENIRSALKDKNLKLAEDFSKNIFELLTPDCADNRNEIFNFNLSTYRPSEATSALAQEHPFLFMVQEKLVHTPFMLINGIKGVDDLYRLYKRPVNVLGQVPNSGKDVGGTPLWARDGSDIVKICLELPHMAENDRTEIFSNTEKATHYNPGFVAAELVDDSVYAAARDDFWILAKKQYRGDTVLYKETVLYEILGNSKYANVFFLEIPRLLFNPHKSVEDTINNTREKFKLSFPLTKN